MSTLPTFSFSCIAADNAGNPVLFGVNSGRLEAHAIDLTNALAPTSTLISATSTPSGWDAQSNLGCYSYAGNAPSPSYPINILQFGATNNLQVQFYPNGTWVSPVETTTASTLNYQSPKLFSLVGSTNGWNWFVARTTSTGGTASWRGVRAGARIDAGPQDLMPGSEPLFTVGAIAQDIANFGNGFLFSFDQSGSAGTAYQAVGNKKPDRNLTSTESLLNLTKVNAVNMNSLVVTQDAIPLASGFSAFVVDKSPAGLISVMSIDPRSFNYKLVQSPVTGPSPVFLSGQSAASVSSKIIVYGGTSPSGPSNNIHSFDIISGTWSGPALADAPNGNGAKSGLSPAIIGGAVAGVLVLLAVLGLFVYRRRRSTKLLPLKLGTLSGTEDRDNKQAMINMMNMEDKSTNAPLSVATLSPPSPGFNRSEYRDSGSYKVEYRDSGSSSSPATAVLATASTPPMPTPRNRRKVPSPAVAESDTIFTNVFPLPPARSGGPNHGQSSPISLQDLSPMPYKMNREQQKLWQERQMELLQEQRQQRQHQQSPEEERQLDPQYQHQLKTPKLASLPRPVIRN
ncbi:hypothetical protein BGZ52_004307 [Haplosporangium bisporale]|nr:hypothetical protein BGZ52_004307 [Haplosporangium bisporale]